MTEQNRFAPPGAEVADLAPARGPGSWVLALVAGFIIDMVGTVVVVTLWGAAYTGVLVAMGTPAEAVMASLQQPSPFSSPFSTVATLLGCATSVLGGFACSRIARRWEYRLGLALAALLLATTVVTTPDIAWSMTNGLMAVATIGCVLLGSHLGRARATRSAA